MFKKKTPEMLSMIRLSKRPSTVVMVPETTIQPIPASGIRPSKMEIKSITDNNNPPQDLAESRQQVPECAANLAITNARA